MTDGQGTRNMTHSPFPLRDEIPLQREYDTLVRPAVFRDLEAFSQAFLERCNGVS